MNKRTFLLYFTLSVVLCSLTIISMATDSLVYILRIGGLE